MTNHKHESHKTAIGFGLAALAAAAAGAYYLYGSDKVSKNRRKVKSWMLKMKAEVMDKIEEAKELTEEGYQNIVDTAAEKYRALKDVDADEVSELANRMRSHWKDIKDDLADAADMAKDQVKHAMDTKKSSEK
ncbi:MAG: hypothetical protein AAB365_02500 [Patescibacteria group bacterium]